MDLVAYLKGEWLVISQAPVTFLTGALVIGALSYAFVRHQFSDRLASLGERLRLKDDRLKEYADKLSGASPDEARRMIASLEKRLDALEPRSLTPEQLDRLRQTISKTVGSVQIVKDMASADATKMQAQLEAIFRQSRWEVSSGMVIGVGNPPKCGIAISAAMDDPSAEDASTILAAFDAAGIDYEHRQPPPPPPNSAKPIPEILLTNVT